MSTSLRVSLTCTLVIASLALAASAYAESQSPVPLEHRSWRFVPVSESAGHGGHGTEAGAFEKRRTVSHAKEETDRFHVTALRLWLYRNFLPNSDDSSTLGIEFNVVYRYWMTSSAKPRK